MHCFAPLWCLHCSDQALRSPLYAAPLPSPSPQSGLLKPPTPCAFAASAGRWHLRRDRRMAALHARPRLLPAARQAPRAAERERLHQPHAQGRRGRAHPAGAGEAVRLFICQPSKSWCGAAPPTSPCISGLPRRHQPRRVDPWTLAPRIRAAPGTTTTATGRSRASASR